MIESAVYLLCTLTSLGAALLLLRGYRRSGTRLLLWSSICFFGLALNNALILVDIHMVPDADLSAWRTIPALAGVASLLYGLVVEAQ